jgi:hypothetical protein
MGWSNLSVYQVTLAAGARAEFRSIPASMLKKVEKKDPYEFAHVSGLLGASAFYANDITHAEQLLLLAKQTYDGLASRTDHLDSMAAANFFLGLIAKSWIDENSSLEDALGKAKVHLETAERLLLDTKKNEFLVPVTLAEIESYIDARHSDARERLDHIVKDLEGLPTRDNNQSRLLVRACLLRGNLERGVDAESAYQKALSYDSTSAYAMLSIALNSEKRDYKKSCFSEGLAKLEKTDALNKHELTTRATALSWAVIASHALGNVSERGRYQTELENIQTAAVSTGGKIPLFFSPISRRLLRFDELRSEIAAYVAAPAL